jgi:hypothetical protein
MLYDFLGYLTSPLEQYVFYSVEFGGEIHTPLQVFPGDVRLAR